MNTSAFAYVVVLVRSFHVQTLPETHDPNYAYHIAVENEKQEGGIDRVSIHEFPVGRVPPLLEIRCDSPDDDRTVVYVATKPRPDGPWQEHFYHQFQEKVLGVSPGSRDIWVL